MRLFFHNLSCTRLCPSTLSTTTYNNIKHVQRSILICFNEQARIKMVIKSELNSNYMHLYGNLQKESILYIRLFSYLDTRQRLSTLSYNMVAGINSKHMEPSSIDTSQWRSNRNGNQRSTQFKLHAYMSHVLSTFCVIVLSSIFHISSQSHKSICRQL